MNVYLIDYIIKVKKNKKLKGIVYAHKAGIICLSGSAGSFFTFKCTVFNCRDPPFINLN